MSCICSVEAVYPDGSVEPGAGKVMPYHTAEEQRKVNNELAALQDAEDCPLLGQLLAVFTHMDPADGKQYLWMILEEATFCLLHNQADPWAAAKGLIDFTMCHMLQCMHLLVAECKLDVHSPFPKCVASDSSDC